MRGLRLVRRDSLLLISVRMRLPPLPRATNNVGQVRMSRLPAEHFARTVGFSNQARGIARTAWPHLHGNLAARDGARCLDDFEHRIAFAVAEVDELTLAACAQVLEREQMRGA